MTPQPLFSRVFVRPFEEEKDGIWLPDGSRAFVQRGVVTAVGDDVQHLGVGDEVMYNPDGATELHLPLPNGEKEKIHLVEERQVLVLLATAYDRSQA